MEPNKRKLAARALAGAVLAGALMQMPPSCALSIGVAGHAPGHAAVAARK
jgi:hypothetical protein